MCIFVCVFVSVSLWCSYVCMYVSLCVSLCVCICLCVFVRMSMCAVSLFPVPALTVVDIYSFTRYNTK